jgi:glycosyltransferase involved in cell wall biosynthesis
VQLLARGLHGRGREIHILAILDHSGLGEEFLEPLEHVGVPIHRLRIHSRNYAAELRFVHRTCRKLSPHVVHTHGSRTDVLDATLARLLDFPTVTTVHGASRLGGRSALYEWLQERSYRRFDAVVAVSEPLRAELVRRLGVPAERVHLIPNAWPGDVEFLPRAVALQQLGLGQTAVPIIGWIGRLIPVKGADVFLSALSLMQDLPWQAVVVGDGPERPALIDLAQSLGIDERLRFAGTVVSAARLNRAFDVYVLSSRSEGTPIALLEAMAANVPVVASAVGGIPVLLGDSAGVLVPPNSPAALASALRRALSDTDGMQRLARTAAMLIEQEYAPGPFLDRYDRLYDLLSHRRPTARKRSPISRGM